MVTPVSRDHTAELGTRPVGSLLWRYCTQTTLSVGIYGVYALTNAWFVAWGVGESALAAVNLVAPVLLLVGAMSTTVGVGGASLVSRALGAGDPARAARAAGTSFTLFWVTALIVAAVGMLAIEVILDALGAIGPIREHARPYALVILAGAVVSTGFSAIVRTEGRLRFSVLLWVIPVIVQITLDPVLIFGFGMGTAGAALGTVGGQAVSAAMALWFFFGQRRRPYRIRWADLRPRWAVAREVLAVGAPSFLAGAGATVLVVVVNLNLAAAGLVVGTAALAAYAVAARIQTFASMPQLGITQGVQPIVGFNAGRGLGERVIRTRNLALAATVGYGALAAAAVVATAPLLVAAFISDPELAPLAVDAVRLVALGLVFAGVTPLASAYFQALGQVGPSYLLSIGTVVALKIPLVLVCSLAGPHGTWAAIPLGEALSALVAFIVLRVRASAR